ncbi:hypothetical protein OS493_023868 [Desmophyllum pertusum]|uniref:Secreted protein n=1 Tax=Desmophyllum pertusum TaxID=174260 RepID=A0A9W9YM24_9CNID|nr:hypothetical protein OS493_023868 [Desmophyllum pertusum]
MILQYFILNVLLATIATAKKGEKTCLLYAAPKNGALACSYNDAGEVFSCAAMCRSSLDFVFEPAYLYYCTGGQWHLYIFPGLAASPSLPWPDCYNKASPSQIKTSKYKSTFFFDGDARDPSVQDAMKTKFLEFIKIPSFPPFFCDQKPDCTKENIKVHVGAGF